MRSRLAYDPWQHRQAQQHRRLSLAYRRALKDADGGVTEQPWGGRRYDQVPSVDEGKPMPDMPKSSPTLRLDKTLWTKKELAKVRDNFSAVVFHEGSLWLGGDEGTCIERLSQDATGNFDRHKRFDLMSLLDLPGGPKSEIDIEGLDINNGYLWLTGSHSLKRKKPEDDESPAENLARLSHISADGNRFTLARVPLTSGPDPQPAAQTNSRTARRLEGDAQRNLLIDALAEDPHLGCFVPRLSEGRILGIPSKDNGLDVEGLAVSGDRIFLGLRGPVLRGWAVVLEMHIAESAHGLTLGPLGTGGVAYRKHFLQLGGIGIRDLVIHEKDVFVLAGPTMDLDGPVFIYRWEKALDQASDSIIGQKDLQKVVAVPFGAGTDHAEGLTLIPHSSLSALVCYDSPDKLRIVGPDEDGVRADIFDLHAV